MPQQHGSGQPLGLPQISTGATKYKVYAADGARALGMVPRLNKTAGVLTSGEVLVDDLTNARGLASSTNSPDFRTTYCVPKIRDNAGVLSNMTIAVDDEDWVYGPGAYVSHCDLDATAVSVDEYLKHSTTAKKLTGTGVIARAGTLPPPGACAIAKASKGAGAGQIAVQLIETERPTMQGFDYATQVNTAAEQTVLTTTLRANSMGANGFFRLKVYLNTRNGTGLGKTFTPKLTLGATIIYQPTATFATDADATKRGMWEIEITVRNTATNAQIVSQRHNARDTFAASATGNLPAVTTHAQGHATAAIDTTADVTLTMTMTMESADANLAWYLVDARLEGPFYQA